MVSSGPPTGTLLPAGELPPRGRVRVLAAVLGLIAGYGDVVGFLVLFGVFTAHMSGNTTHFGASVAGGDWTDAAVRFFPIPMFVLAIAIGTILVEKMRRRGDDRDRLAPLLATEGGLLVAFVLVAVWATDHDRLQPASAAFFVLAALLTVTMGLQTAVLRRIGGLTVHTTYVSGMLTQVSVGAVTWWFDRRDASAQAGSDTAPTGGDGPAAHAWVALGVWGCFALGAFLGALGHRWVDAWALLVPAAALATLAVFSFVVPSLTRPPR